MFDTQQFNETVDTMVNKTEENLGKVTGYIQDTSTREIAQAVHASGFTVARTMIQANRDLADTFARFFAAK